MKARRLGLGARLLTAALLLIALTLPVAGVLLAYNFKQSVTTAFDERLGSLLNVVLAGATFDAASGRLVSRRDLGDARFEQVFSGWYWQLSDGGERVLTSRSLWDQRLPVTANSDVDIRNIDGPRGQRLRRIERDVQLPKLQQTVHVSVAVDRAELDQELANFQGLLWLSLVALGLLLLAGQALQIHWGLAPLRRIRRDLKAVEEGERNALNNELPRELSQLADAINTVLHRDQQLMERGRNAAGNLAHALKTPVSVLYTLAERLPAEHRQGIQQELARLNEAVSHHLARASAAAPLSLGRTVDIVEALAPVIAGISRLAQRRGLHFDSAVAAMHLAIDPQDLQEMVGNLLENACSWASRQVQLQGELSADTIVLSVSDDGPGMTEEDCQQALQRGLRLDESRSGSGLGLAIVNDLATLYGGSLTLGRAASGGLLAQLRFPRRPD